ncbi:MAG: hypothetical protein LBC56_02070 [Oscillospiraceae bacterium]|jgi:hypothetical protein|nr:hypothetical protein [Oscillospiraceae bacterium]
MPGKISASGASSAFGGKELRRKAFSERFEGKAKINKTADFPLQAVGESDTAAAAVARLSLGDKYFDKTELDKTQAIINQYSALKKKYPKFPLVIGNDENGNASVFLGGNQSWFRLNGHYAKYFGGCGPVAATNIMANLAFKNASVAQKLGFPQWNSSQVASMGEYLNLMEDVYSVVTPMEVPLAKLEADKNKSVTGFPASFGIIDANFWKNAVLKYAKSKGIDLKAQSLDRDFDGNNPYDVKKLEEALKNGCAIGFLNLLTALDMYLMDGRKYTSYERHWVAIVGKEGDKLIISSWGMELYLKYSDIIQAAQKNLAQSLNNMTYFEAV